MPPKDKKILYFDTETTGFDPVVNDIAQIAGIIEINNEVVEKFDFRCQPLNWESINPEALKITGIGIKELKKLPKPGVVHKELLKTLGRHVDKYDKSDKLYMGGYNVRFDVDFLHNFFKKQGDDYFGSWFNWRLVDPLPILHYLDWRGDYTLPNYKLETACEHFGIKIKAHDAMSDIEATRKVLSRVTMLLDGEL